ncbi:MAG: hypothetical protein LBV14_16730, partial [Acidovorax sp.]|nr:hypothetical protein [Acidovorax sp.]
ACAGVFDGVSQKILAHARLPPGRRSPRLVCGKKRLLPHACSHASVNQVLIDFFLPRPFPALKMPPRQWARIYFVK